MGADTLTRNAYEFRDIRRGVSSGTPCARFSVELANGQTHEELLSFAVLEARIMTWEDTLQRDPGIVLRDTTGFANYRQFVRALVEGLRLQAI